MDKLMCKFDGEAIPKAMCFFDRESDTEPDDCMCCNEVCEEFRGNGCGECPVQKAFVRLAEYERTNLTPEQLAELDKLYLAKCEEVNRLNTELAELKKQVPACNIGDTAYIVDFEEGVINKSIVNGIVCRIDRQDTEFEYDSDLLEFHSDDVGVIVFQSYKEAQDALERNIDV